MPGTEGQFTPGDFAGPLGNTRKPLVLVGGQADNL